MSALTQNQMNLISELALNESARMELERISLQKLKTLQAKPFQKVRSLFDCLDTFPVKSKKFDSDAVSIGEQDPVDPETKERVIALAKELIPWKKGPFNLFGIHIDAEWQSQLKWKRLLPFLPDLKDKFLLDVGCNNGYYLFKMLDHDPARILGIDPMPRVYYQFQLIQLFLSEPRLQYQMWGWQETGLFKPVFDVIFCMGIIYHHRDPIQVLKNMYHALKPGGTLVLETIVTPGKRSYCLFPEDRYAMMRNVWFVPTVEATRNFLKRTRFSDIQSVSDVLHLPEEQRTTDWNPAPSYREFLDPKNNQKTVEGYPAPRRAILIARKKANA
ncbi:MAG: tRNA 5-methoxyuridine(34)/uridine 5-oxyacetic acid(34) synthase CmoB [Acidobacteria bacterium]|nr:MAG: tRNA 5-methoxyuridine(34)/uridine 5-oxyacetic acid(34) synthase CmoB [Acidobacteriota bacterium]